MLAFGRAAGAPNCTEQPRQRQQRRLMLATVILALFITSTYILLRVQLPFIACPLEPKTQCMYGPG